MPAVTDKIVSPGISGRKVAVRPCIRCGCARDVSTAYTTRQGKRSIRTEPRCRECGKAWRRELHDRDREASREVHRKWQVANREHTRAYNKARQQDPAHRAVKAYHQRLRCARMRGGEGDSPAIRSIYSQAVREEALIQNCPLFDLPELGKKLHVDHVTPLARGGRHVADNLQILAAGLNMRKGVRCPQ